MPKCYECGTEQPILMSITAVKPDGKGRLTTGSYALCDKHFKEAEKKEAERK